MKPNQNQTPPPDASKHTEPEVAHNAEMNPTVSTEATGPEKGGDPALTNPPAQATGQEEGGVVVTESTPKVEEVHAEQKPVCQAEPPSPAEPGLLGDTQGRELKKKSRTVKKPRKWQTMNGKPILRRYVQTVLTLNNEEFREKLLCDVGVLNLGDSCPLTCTYCYVESCTCGLDVEIVTAFNTEHGTSFEFQDVVIRRENALEVLQFQLNDLDEHSRSVFANGVVFLSSLVDPAGNMKLLRETAAACLQILEQTDWQIRILSKCTLLNLILKFIPQKYHRRLILGYSIGTLDDKIAKAIEVSTSPPSKRVKALRRLQDLGIRTFGMICPSLPQEDYDKFCKEICKAIRVERCEHVWAEVLNVRGKNRTKTIGALREAGFEKEAALLDLIMVDDETNTKWEEYARATFEGHCKYVPAGKLRFLQYATKETIDWWADRRDSGAVPIGAEAKIRMLLAGGQSAPMEPLSELTEEDIQYRQLREEIVSTGVKASIHASKALHEIYHYKNGLLWREYGTFERYVKVKWAYESSQGYRYVKAGEVIAVLENGLSNADGEPPVELPRNECQIRAFQAVCPEEHMPGCWKYVASKTEPDKLTGAMVDRFAREYLKNKKLPLPTKRKSSKPKSDWIQKALRALDRLCGVIDLRPESKQFESELKGFRARLLSFAPDPTIIDVDASVLDDKPKSDSESPASPGTKAPVAKRGKRGKTAKPDDKEAAATEPQEPPATPKTKAPTAMRGKRGKTARPDDKDAA